MAWCASLCGTVTDGDPTVERAVVGPIGGLGRVELPPVRDIDGGLDDMSPSDYPSFVCSGQVSLLRLNAARAVISADYFMSLKSYKDGNFVVFNSVMPPVRTVAYMAEALYPDLVGTGYGDSVNQKYIDTFFPSFAEGFDVTDYDFMITYDMVKDSL